MIKKLINKLFKREMPKIERCKSCGSYSVRVQLVEGNSASFVYRISCASIKCFNVSIPSLWEGRDISRAIQAWNKEQRGEK